MSGDLTPTAIKICWFSDLIHPAVPSFRTYIDAIIYDSGAHPFSCKAKTRPSC